MSSETSGALVDNVAAAEPINSGESNKSKVPKRVHKAEREKLKREHLNELFLDLACALELNENSNGKAAILCEATRFLKDLFGQIETLKKENMSLLSESNYVKMEKKELKEETTALETQIEKIQTKLEARLAQTKPDLNAPPPEFQHPREATFHQPSAAVVFVPVPEDLRSCPAPGSGGTPSNPSLNVSKPHARYPSPSDSWPSQLLKEQPGIGERNSG